jgi:hypothetical protein
MVCHLKRYGPPYVRLGALGKYSPREILPQTMEGREGAKAKTGSAMCQETVGLPVLAS